MYQEFSPAGKYFKPNLPSPPPPAPTPNSFQRLLRHVTSLPGKLVSSVRDKPSQAYVRPSLEEAIAAWERENAWRDVLGEVWSPSSITGRRSSDTIQPKSNRFRSSQASSPTATPRGAVGAESSRGHGSNSMEQTGTRDTFSQNLQFEPVSPALFEWDNPDLPSTIRRSTTLPSRRHPNVILLPPPMPRRPIGSSKPKLIPKEQSCAIEQKEVVEELMTYPTIPKEEFSLDKLENVNDPTRYTSFPAYPETPPRSPIPSAYSSPKSSSSSSSSETTKLTDTLATEESLDEAASGGSET
ncbi:hypothetical protein CROQUDRAFT_140757 [Cronartium quercuum f. sp. fusiforme G11]|uniref:Uncharacterized protein n=1 Tax=Cronartium quercuum f. sp. fusiforme G11 TaxID=708437 RepID=A0A9P6TI33_9BASI|nr:hypothetical protein CROQUDRAFT_140757 [Cronartium quercuum f. sp. fusiforme G11]